MSKINIKYMTADCIETLRNRMDTVTRFLSENPDNCMWLDNVFSGKKYEEKKFQIEDFTLEIPSNDKDRDTDIRNSIVLYEHLKDLPKYVLTDERFWNWINFEKAYKVALKYMPVKENGSVFKDHWLFSQGQRRSLFFGVLARCYYRVELTYDSTLDDPYELSKYAIKNPERFRNLTWRTYSGDKKIVRGCLKAAKYIDENYGNIEDIWKFTDIAKYISKLGSVMLLDAMDEIDIYNSILNEYKRIASIN